METRLKAGLWMCCKGIKIKIIAKFCALACVHPLDTGSGLSRNGPLGINIIKSKQSDLLVVILMA